MATHVALESVHHLHCVHDVVAGGWADHLRCRTLAGSASCVGNGPAGRAGQAADHRSCPGPQEVRKYRSLHSLPCGVHSSVCSTPPGAPAAAARCERLVPERPTFGRLPGAYFRVVAHLHSDCVGSVAVVFSGFLMRRPLAGAHARRGATACSCASSVGAGCSAAQAANGGWRLLVLKVPCAARGAEQAVELSAPPGRPAEPRAHASSRSRCAGTSRVRVLCVVVLWRRARLLE